MINGSVLTTDRLVIRPFEPEDAVALVALFADPMVARYVDEGKALSLDNAKLWTLQSLKNLGRFGYGTGAVALREQQDSVIGWAGIARPEDDEEEMIYGLSQQHWGKGFGKEIVEAIVGYVRSLGKSTLRATVHSRNSASVRVLKHHGFHLTDVDYRGEEHCDLYQLYLRAQKQDEGVR